jgi:hypothetical protein
MQNATQWCNCFQRQYLFYQTHKTVNNNNNNNNNNNIFQNIPKLRPHQPMQTLYQAIYDEHNALYKTTTTTTSTLKSICFHITITCLIDVQMHHHQVY